MSAIWNETQLGQHRIRWRHDGEEHAATDSGYHIEQWIERTSEWHPVQNWNSREWFVLGLRATGGGQ